MGSGSSKHNSGPKSSLKESSNISRESNKSKKKKGNSVKIKDKKKKKRSQESQSGFFGDKVTLDSNSAARLFRRKSSCPSATESSAPLDFKDKPRSASKSLRYSDFNKVLRTSRINNDGKMKPTDIPLYDTPAVSLTF